MWKDNTKFSLKIIYYYNLLIKACGVCKNKPLRNKFKKHTRKQNRISSKKIILIHNTFTNLRVSYKNYPTYDKSQSVFKHQ